MNHQQRIVELWDSGVENVDRISKIIKTDKRKVRKMLVDNARIARTYCAECRIQIRHHPRCSGCEILIHGRDRCSSCSMDRAERLAKIMRNV